MECNVCMHACMYVYIYIHTYAWDAKENDIDIFAGFATNTSN